jgi:superfamily II DNA/RNA helicase
MLFAPAVVYAHSAHFGGGSVLFWLLARDFNMKEYHVSFEKLNFNPVILKAIVESGYTEPTPIQAQAIPEILAGKDVMASAQTGTGKTAAFILPALQRLSTPSVVKSHGPRVLVLTPDARTG